MQAKGSQAVINIYEQTALNVISPNITLGLTLPTISSTMAKTQPLIRSQVLRGNRNQTMPTLDEIGVSGSIVIQPDVASIIYILKHLMGLPVTTGVGPYTHTFKVLSTIPPYGLTIEKVYADIAQVIRYIGCKLNKLSFDVTSGGYLQATLDFLGIDASVAVAALDAAPKLYAVQPFRLPRVTLSEGGSSMLTATRLSLSIENNITATKTLGNSGLAYDLPEGLIAISGSLEVLFENMTMYNKAINATPSSLVITFPAFTGGQSLQFTIPEEMYAVGDPTLSGPGGVTLPLQFEAYYDSDAGASSVQAVVVNAIASAVAFPA